MHSAVVMVSPSSVTTVYAMRGSSESTVYLRFARACHVASDLPRAPLPPGCPSSYRRPRLRCVGHMRVLIGTLDDECVLYWRVVWAYRWIRLRGAPCCTSVGAGLGRGATRAATLPCKLRPFLIVRDHLQRTEWACFVWQITALATLSGFRRGALLGTSCQLAAPRSPAADQMRPARSDVGCRRGRTALHVVRSARSK